MENHNSQEMLQRIKSKLGFDIRNYKADDTDKIGEIDNIPNPFDKLSLEELLFIREHKYFIQK